MEQPFKTFKTFNRFAPFKALNRVGFRRLEPLERLERLELVLLTLSCLTFCRANFSKKSLCLFVRHGLQLNQDLVQLFLSRKLWRITFNEDCHLCYRGRIEECSGRQIDPKHGSNRAREYYESSGRCPFLKMADHRLRL